MRRDRSIQRSLGIPGTEDIHSVIALGKPNVTYLRPAGRKPARIRYAFRTET
jgi:hypothetical protein